MRIWSSRWKASPACSNPFVRCSPWMTPLCKSRSKRLGVGLGLLAGTLDLPAVVALKKGRIPQSDLKCQFCKLPALHQDLGHFFTCNQYVGARRKMHQILRNCTNPEVKTYLRWLLDCNKSPWRKRPVTKLKLPDAWYSLEGKNADRIVRWFLCVFVYICLTS